MAGSGRGFPHQPNPENQHSCVCGWTTSAWANLLVHRRSCDSWQEHEQALQARHSDRVERARLDAAAYDRETDYECPYCGQERKGAKGLYTHLNSCSAATAKFEGITFAPQTIERLIRTFEKQLDFAAWEWRRENGIDG